MLKKLYIFSVLAVFFLVAPLTVSLNAQTQQAKTKAVLVWSFFDGDHHVVSSSLVGEKWSDPIAIHSSENLIVTPSLAKTGSDQTMVVWSEQVLGKVRVYQSVLSSQSNEWTEPEALVDEGGENLNPNLINDGQGGLWLFWSGNNGGLDDIFYKKRSLEDNEWSEVKQLNPPNEVPDYKPVAELDEFGDIRVRWQTFDFLSSRYVEASETIIIDQKVAYSADSAANDLELADIILPEFLPKDSAVSLLFPNNVAVQSIRVD